MGREIKFRAWDGEKFVKSKCGYCGSEDFNTSYEITQYTGLKDKQKKEIYEGDIVKTVDYSRAHQGATFVVKWREEEVEDGFCGFWHGYNIDNKTVEVIGNIYENPELLEENK